MGAWVGALDGGGTKTASALADRRGDVTILPVLPGCSPQDGPAWEGILGEALRRMARAGLAGAVLGMPGRGEVPAHDAAVEALVASVMPGPVEIMNDVGLARLAAFGGGDGVLLLSGTGSMAWAKGPAGEARVGGWGDAFGDEGSAFWIGREALTLVARALDGRGPEGRGPKGRGPDATGFAHALCARLGADAAGPFAPLAWLMGEGGGRAAVAGVARHMDPLADEGHEWGWLILRRAARHLAEQARVAARRAGLGDAPRWVPSGGAFRSARLRGFVAESLRAEPAEPRLGALAGGLLRAAEVAGWSPDEAWAAKVDARLRAFA